MFAGTQTPSSALRLEVLFPLQPRTFDAPAMSERFAKIEETMQKIFIIAIFESNVALKRAVSSPFIQVLFGRGLQLFWGSQCQNL